MEYSANIPINYSALSVFEDFEEEKQLSPVKVNERNSGTYIYSL